MYARHLDDRPAARHEQAVLRNDAAARRIRVLVEKRCGPSAITAMRSPVPCTQGHAWATCGCNLQRKPQKAKGHHKP